MNVLVLMPYLYDTVPGQRFRIEQWVRELEPQGHRFDYAVFESPELKRVMYAKGAYGRKILALLSCIGRQIRFVKTLRPSHDAVFLFRQLLPIGPPFLERALARRGIPFVYDFDDSIFLPDVSDANKHVAWLKWPQKTAEICRLSAHVTVGNPYLAAWAHRHTPRVSVVPTTIDTKQYRPKESMRIAGRPVIGWSGSLTTAKHLKTLAGPLQALAKTMDFRLQVVGAPDTTIEGVDVTARPWSAKTETDDIKTFDVGIMPLPDDDWSKGKCGLKALQYMALGVPTIASPVGVNGDIIQDGHNGFLASTPEEWVDKLTRLIRDESLRARFAKEGRRTVEARYSAEVQAPRLVEILRMTERDRAACAA